MQRFITVVSTTFLISLMSSSAQATYVYNDPVNQTDPSGMCPECSALIAINNIEDPAQRQQALSNFSNGQGAGLLIGAGTIGAVLAAPIAGSLGLGGTGTGLAGAAIQSGGIGMVQSTVNDVVNNEGNVNFGDVGIDTAFNAVGGLVGKAAGVPAIGSMIAETPVGEPLPPGVGAAQNSLVMQAGAVAGIGGSALTGGNTTENARNAAFGAIGNVNPAFQILMGAGAIAVEADCNANSNC